MFPRRYLGRYTEAESTVGTDQQNHAGGHHDDNVVDADYEVVDDE